MRVAVLAVLLLLACVVVGATTVVQDQFLSVGGIILNASGIYTNNVVVEGNISVGGQANFTALIRSSGGTCFNANCSFNASSDGCTYYPSGGKVCSS